MLQTAEYQKKTIQELYDALYARIEEYEEKLEIGMNRVDLISVTSRH